MGRSFQITMYNLWYALLVDMITFDEFCALESKIWRHYEKLNVSIQNEDNHDN